MLSFCSLIKGITPKIRMLCVILINNVLLNVVCVWILCCVDVFRALIKLPLLILHELALKIESMNTFLFIDSILSANSCE